MTPDTPAQREPSAAGRGEKTLLLFACAGFLVIAAMLWATNGMAVFSEMMLGFWALCF